MNSFMALKSYRAVAILGKVCTQSSQCQMKNNYIMCENFDIKNYCSKQLIRAYAQSAGKYPPFCYVALRSIINISQKWDSPL